MSLLDVIKTSADKARKERNGETAIALMTLYSEAKMLGKNDGDRETTDEEVLQVIQRFIKNINELISHPCNDEFKEKASREKILLESYLPSQLTEEELEIIIKSECDAWPKQLSIGEIMVFLKANFVNQYDSKLASTVARKVLSLVS